MSSPLLLTLGAPGGVVLRVEKEHDRLFPLEGGELNNLVVLVLEREVGGNVAHLGVCSGVRVGEREERWCEGLLLAGGREWREGGREGGKERRATPAGDRPEDIQREPRGADALMVEDSSIPRMQAPARHCSTSSERVMSHFDVVTSSSHRPHTTTNTTTKH